MNLSATFCLKRSLLKKIAVLFNWVRKLHDFCDIKPDSPIISKDIDQFLKKLSSTYESWQVQQASDAVSLYRIFQRRKTTPMVQNSDEPDRQWKHVADEMVRMMRLRHLSIRQKKHIWAGSDPITVFSKANPLKS
ncbi:MAG: hypothetical protein JRC89_08610 [Deltaproteobacteria bacterium]|nr:hypothetical protein [Deltaproteobacteria bacterium]